MKTFLTISIVLLIGCSHSNRVVGDHHIQREGIVSVNEEGFYLSNDTTLYKVGKATLSQNDSCNELPIILEKVLPVYPEICIRAGVEGDVTVKAFLDSEGKLVSSKIYSSDAAVFNEGAIDTVKKIKFGRYRKNCIPEDCVMVVSFHYRLHQLKL